MDLGFAAVAVAVEPRVRQMEKKLRRCMFMFFFLTFLLAW